MRLVIPLVQKLLIPWIIPKKEFTKFGVDIKDIVHYRAIDAAIITKRKISKNSKKLIKKGLDLSSPFFYLKNYNEFKKHNFKYYRFFFFET